MKRANLIEQLKYIRQAATKAGMADHIFLAFGTCLGAVRERGFIEHDNDADIGVLTDKIDKEQEDMFYQGLVDYQLFAKRHKEQRRADTGRLLWNSLKMKKHCYKTCIWYMYEWQGFMWHSKGREWVTQKVGRKLNPPVPHSTHAVAKGIPAKYFEPLVDVDWYHLPWKIPGGYGHCLDLWYPDWNTPRGGSSKAEHIMVVPNWKEPKTWHIRTRR